MWFLAVCDGRPILKISVQNFGIRLVLVALGGGVLIYNLYLCIKISIASDIQTFI